MRASRLHSGAADSMTLASSDPQGCDLASAPHAAIDVLAPRHYQDRALAAYADAELLLSAILPEARIEHVGASAVAGAYSKGDVDICVSVAQHAFFEALGVLGEAGFTIRPQALRTDQLCVLDAPDAEVPLGVQLIEAGSRFDNFTRFRDALRADAALLARYNALRIAAGPQGEAAYRGAKNGFIDAVLSDG
jgi:GrpB-like predicted nucleotidyltransferase (UPF0157 family)